MTIKPLSLFLDMAGPKEVHRLLVADFQVKADEDELLTVRPCLPLDVRPQLIVPPLSALLPNSARKCLCYYAPLPLSLRFHQAAAELCVCYQ